MYIFRYYIYIDIALQWDIWQTKLPMEDHNSEMSRCGGGARLHPSHACQYSHAEVGENGCPGSPQCGEGISGARDRGGFSDIIPSYHQ